MAISRRNDCFCLIGEETVTPRNDKSGSRLPRLFRDSDFESGSVAVGLIPKGGACWKEKPGVPSRLWLCLSQSASVPAEHLAFRVPHIFVDCNFLKNGAPRGTCMLLIIRLGG